MKFGNKTKQKKEAQSSNKATVSQNPVKKKLQRGCCELGISVLGAALAVLRRGLFQPFADKGAISGGSEEVERDNFTLYFIVSLILCAVLLLLTVMSALTYFFQKEVGKFQRFAVSVSPVICSVAVLAVSGFYAYLTAGGEVNITGYLVLLGIGEAMLFRLPCAVYVFLRKGEKAPKNQIER